MFSRIFGVSAPFIPKLACLWKPMPMLVLGVPSVAIAGLAYFLPETKDTNLLHTMNDTQKELKLSSNKPRKPVSC